MRITDSAMPSRPSLTLEVLSTVAWQRVLVFSMATTAAPTPCCRRTSISLISEVLV